MRRSAPHAVWFAIVLAAATFLAIGGPAGWARQEAPEDETKVPPYVLPDPLVLADGRKVANARTWTETRRPELLRFFETHVYGRTPAGGPRPRFQAANTHPSALGGRATRKDVTITFGDRMPGARSACGPGP